VVVKDKEEKEEEEGERQRLPKNQSSRKESPTFIYSDYS
jgi:hypothetical protein